MKTKFIFCLIISILTSNLYFKSIIAQTSDWVWAKSIGGVNYDFGKKIVTDNYGNAYVVGYYKSANITIGSAIYTNAGNEDIFIIKYDASGNVLWSKSIGGTNKDFGESIATDELGNVYVTGWYASTSLNFGSINLTGNGLPRLFVVKYDPFGNVSWAKSNGGNDLNTVGYRVTTDVHGNVYVTGTFTCPGLIFDSILLINTNIGSDEIFIVKYNSLGNVLWAKSVKGMYADFAFGITVDTFENVYMTGYYSSPSLTFGSITIYNAGNKDIFVVKYNASGNTVWAKSIGGNSDDKGYGIAVNTLGDVYLTGDYYSTALTFNSDTLINIGGADTYLLKYDTSGNFIWAKSEGGIGDDCGRSITTDSSLYIYISGHYSSPTLNVGNTTLTNTGGYDIFIVKYNSSGNVIWGKSEGGTSSEYSQSITTDVSGNIYIAGYYNSSTLSFGSAVLTNLGNSDIFIAKLDIATGINEMLISEKNWVIYPNPSDGVFYISTDSNEEIPVVVSVSNYLGEPANYRNSVNNGSLLIDLSGNPKGLYLLKISYNDNNYFYKLILL